MQCAKWVNSNNENPNKSGKFICSRVVLFVLHFYFYFFGTYIIRSHYVFAYNRNATQHSEISWNIKCRIYPNAVFICLWPEVMVTVDVNRCERGCYGTVTVNIYFISDVVFSVMLFYFSICNAIRNKSSRKLDSLIESKNYGKVISAFFAAQINRGKFWIFVVTIFFCFAW